MISYEQALSKLSLSEKWVDYEIVSMDDIRLYAQEALDNHTIVDHTGSYFLYKFLESIYKLSKKQVGNYIDIVLSEIDQGQIYDCLSWLMESNALSLDLLLSLNNCDFIGKYNLKNQYKRCYFIKRLEDYSADSALLFEAIDSDDPKVQSKVLEIFGDRIEVLERLADRGVNKKIRNISKEKLRKKIGTGR
ncbi:MAG: hypothetical protein HQK76_20870 [Desulfobacterales bacterium]|nr:hypothetical protein [Desulfobacterales bacterium]